MSQAPTGHPSDPASDPTSKPARRSHALITGSTAGLGYFTAERLAQAGWQVSITGRDPTRTARALASLRHHAPHARIDALPLDLTDPDSVRALAARLRPGRLDALILNAGVTSPPRRRRETPDGVEFTFASNVLGHGVLAALAWPALERSSGRLVGLGSLATRTLPASVDLLSTRSYRPFRAYATSKHAMHGLILELDRRTRAAGSPVRALLAHPGYAVDGLTRARPGIVPARRWERLPFAHGKDDGAEPSVHAVIADLPGGALVGPRGLTRGAPSLAQPAAGSADPDFGALVLRTIEDLGGVEFLR